MRKRARRNVNFENRALKNWSMKEEFLGQEKTSEKNLQRHYIVAVVRIRRLRWTGQVRRGEDLLHSEVLNGQPKGERPPIVRPDPKRQGEIQMNRGRNAASAELASPKTS